MTNEENLTNEEVIIDSNTSTGVGVLIGVAIIGGGIAGCNYIYKKVKKHIKDKKNQELTSEVVIDAEVIDFEEIQD